MLRKCKTCNHSCHCYGQGYNLNTNKCDNCICDACTCKNIYVKTPSKKSWWQKIKGWLF